MKSTAAMLTTVLLMGMSSARAQDAAATNEAKTMGKLMVVADEEKESAQPSTAGTKTDVPLIETPQAVSVVTAATIKERGITDLVDALRGIAGVSRSSTYGYYDAYTIRGYDAAYGSVYLDGLTTTNAAGANNELAGLELVEVVKGPASALFGASPLGGIVNLVSKRPQLDPFMETSIATGSYNLIEGSIDANAPLNAAGSLLARVNLLYRDSDDFVDYSGENRIFVAPSLTWNIGDATHLTLLGRYQRDHDNPWSPLTAYGTVLPSAYGELPIEFSINSNGSQRAIHNQERKQVGYVFDHSFSEAVTFSQTVRYSHARTYWNNWIFSEEFIDSSFVNGVQQGHVLGLYVYGPFRQADNDFAADNRLVVKFDTGVASHSVLAGIDYKRIRNRNSDDGGNFDSTANTLDILAPDYSAPLLHDPIWAYSGSSKSRQVGYYLQDHVGFAEKFFMTLGGRWDQVDTDGQEDHAFSPRVGANYTVVPGVSLYANWSKAFTPQFGYVVDVDGNSLPPESGRNIEGGVKFAAADGTFNALIAVFQLTRQNVATEDPLNPFFYVVTGEQRSRGFEIEGTWKPAPAWTGSLAYSYIDAEVSQDNLIAAGTVLPNVPRHNLYLYGKYVVQQGLLANLGVDASFLRNSRKNSSLYPVDVNGDGSLEPAIVLPGYSLVDAGLSYVAQGWETRLAANNIFDKRYYPDAGYYTRITPGEPRNWRVSVSRRF